MLKNKKGFTLMEMLITVLLIGILGALAFPNYVISVEKTRVTTNISLLKPIYDSALQYYSTYDEFPDKLTKLSVGLPDTFSISGQTATGPNNCSISLDESIPAMTMTCGKGTGDYILEFRYRESAATGYSRGKLFFKPLGSDAERTKTFKKVATSSGWGPSDNGYYEIDKANSN